MKSLVLPFRRARIRSATFRLAAVVKVIGVVAILFVGCEMVVRLLLFSRTVFFRQRPCGPSLVFGIWLSGLGALLACLGAIAGRPLEGRSEGRGWILFIYAAALCAAGFALLLHSFAVSGASCSWS